GAVVVAVNDVRALDLRPLHGVVAGNDEPAAPRLHTAARARGVPGPVRGLGRRRDVCGLRPGGAVVRAFQQPHGPRTLARAVEDLPLGVLAEVAGQGQPDSPVAPIEDGTGVADGVGTVVPDDRHGLPGRAAVQAALPNEIDIAAVAAAVLPPFAEGQQ